MHATSSLWGVRGIFPFLRTVAPSTLRSIPPSQLSGLTLAIDATLVSTRFHFADDPHPARHLLGFYRLIKSLRALNARSIMVFDHPLGGTRARNPAKLQEAERRRTQRELVSKRASLERNRNRRIQRLSGLMLKYAQLDPNEAKLLHRELRRLHREDTDEDHAHEDIESKKQDDPVQPDLSPTILDADFDNDWDELQPAAFDEIIEQQNSEGAEVLTSVDRVLLCSKIDIDTLQTDEDVPSSISALASEFHEIRLQFGRLHHSRTNEGVSDDGHRSDIEVMESKKQIALTMAEARIHETMLNRGLHGSDVGGDGVVLPVDDVELQNEDESEGAVEMEATGSDNDPAVPDVLISALSPDQTEADGSVLATEDPSKETDQIETRPDPDQGQSSTPVQSEQVTDHDVQEIHQQSATLSKSYNRASTPLTSQIIIDCAYLCALLGVPVLFTSQGRAPSQIGENGRSTIPGAAWAGVARSKSRAHEAEALASSLVHAGFADVVASEDSDVLMYDVPMLRGLLGGGGPAGGMKGLMWIDAKEVRRSVFDGSEPSASASTNMKKHRSSFDTNVDIDAVLDEAIRARNGDTADVQFPFSPGLQHANELQLPILNGPSRPSEEVVAGQQDCDDTVDDAIEVDDLADAIASAEIENVSQLSADGWNRRRFVEFALLLGTDFNRTIPGVGPKTAYSLMKEHGSIAQILRLRNPAPKQSPTNSRTPSDQKVRGKVNEYKFSPPSSLSRREYSKELTRARDVFMHPPTLAGYLGRLGRWSRGQDYYDWRKAVGSKLATQIGTFNNVTRERQEDTWRRAEMLALFRRNGLHKSPWNDADALQTPWLESPLQKADVDGPFSTSHTPHDTAASALSKLSKVNELDPTQSPFGSDLFGERNVPSGSQASALLLKTARSGGRKITKKQELSGLPCSSRASAHHV